MNTNIKHLYGLQNTGILSHYMVSQPNFKSCNEIYVYIFNIRGNYQCTMSNITVRTEPTTATNYKC